MAKNWNETPEGKQYKQVYNKINYDTIKFEVPKGIKDVFVTELKKENENETIAGFMNRFVTFYLSKQGYTNEQLEEITNNAKELAERAVTHENK